MDPVNTLLECLKSKRYIADIKKAREEVITEKVKLKKKDDLFIRDALAGRGNILKEDLEEHYYVTTVKMGRTGNVLTYAIILREEDDEASIAVYAREGLIKQHLAEKTMEKLKGFLC